MPVGTSAYVPLANVTLGSAASSVTFSSISQSYRDLVLVVNAGTGTNESVNVRINSDSGSNYPFVAAIGNGSSTGSSATTLTQIQTNYGINGSTSHNVILNFMDYSATDKHKTVLYRTNISDAGTTMGAVRWANTSVITTIALVNATYQAGSSFSLYGIAS